MTVGDMNIWSVCPCSDMMLVRVMCICVFEVEGTEYRVYVVRKRSRSERYRDEEGGTSEGTSGMNADEEQETQVRAPSEAVGLLPLLAEFGHALVVLGVMTRYRGSMEQRRRKRSTRVMRAAGQQACGHRRRRLCHLW